MRNFKKFLTLVLAVMMVVTTMSFTTSAAAQFDDVSADNAYLAKSVSLLNYMGIAKGVSDTKFGTDELVTRQQFALFIYRLMKGGKDAPASGNNSTSFTDLQDPTYYYAISWAFSQGIVNGKSDTSFDPTGFITLQEAYAMVVRALSYETEETLPYPYGYIEVAEDEDVALDEGLDSQVDYTDALTRGDMAIILYNTFFAQTGVAETKTRERLIGTGDNATWVLETYEDYPTLCEKAFDVDEVEYQAVATPHYAVDDQKVTDDLGYDAILFERIDDNNETINTDAPALAYIKAEDIGIDTKDLDNYFLAHFTMYVTIDEDDKTIDSVLFADSNMTKKTVNDLKFATVTTNKADSYYTGTDAKLLSGRATTGTDTLYFFNAPYSYASPTYTTGMSDAEKYIVRNTDDVKGISFELGDDVDDGYFYATRTDIVDNEAYDADGFFAEQATDLADFFSQAYYGGLYEADLYDVDGDGVYDYIDYKPYTFFQVDTDDDYNFFDDGVKETTNKVPVLYTNEAFLTGEKIADEDYCIGYYNQDNNTIKVAQVIKPTTAKVKSIKTSTSTVTFTDGTTATVDEAWKYVTNYAPSATAFDVDDYDEFDDFNALLDASVLDSDDIDFYVYNGTVLYQEGADTANLKFSDNLIIPISGYEPREQFNSTLGDMINYIYVWIDGDDKYVPIETDDVYPKVIDNYDSAYVGKLCTYSIDTDGLYTLTSLGYKENEDGEYKGMNQDPDELKDDSDDSIQFYGEAGDGITLTKIAGSRFELTGASTPFSYVVLKSYSKIIIKNYNTATEEDEFIEYDLSTLTASSEVALDNVSYIVSNDVDSTARENLVVLYGEARDFDLDGVTNTSGYRIVSTSTPGVDENGYYRNYYDLFNPFTGKKESDVAGNRTASSSSGLTAAVATGVVVKLKDGKVDDKASTNYGTLNVASDAGLVWITEYDEADKVLEVVPVTAVDSCNDIDNYTYDASRDVNIDGEAFIDTNGRLLYQVDNGTVVTMIKHSDKNDNLTKWGGMSLLDATALASSANTYKCYNDKVEDSKGSYKTEYAKYIKAYFTFSESNDADELPSVDYIVIVVNGGEPLTYLNSYKG